LSIRLNKYSWPLAVPVLLAVVIGVIMVYSSSMALARDTHRDSLYIIKRQLIWVAAGLGVFIFSARFDYHKYRRIARPVLVICCVLLLMVMIPGLGKSSGGAQRWIQLGVFGIQPSELVKYLLIIYLSDLLVRKQGCLHRFWDGFFPTLAISGLLAVLVLIQPDMGNAICIAATGWLMAYLAGAELFHLALVAVPALPAIGYLAISKPYRLRRLVTFLDPWADSTGAGYQIIQAMTALGSGGWTGVGLGESRQKLLYLPAATTDFIFAIIGEELGFLGAALVVLIFLVIIVQGFRVSAAAPDLYGRFLAQGITLMLGLQAFVNFGVVSSILPTKGLPLPFISYGGSNLLCSLFAAGILLNISGQIPSVENHPVKHSSILTRLKLLTGGKYE